MASTSENMNGETQISGSYTAFPRSEKCLKVGPYIITDVIGVGSFSKVRVCIHQQTMARYACKIIEKSLIRHRMSNVQVQREIAIMSRLRHPNTVSLVSVYSTATKVFIVMELVSGCELFDEIERRKRFSEPFARFYFRQLIQGLSYCHSHGIFHRDLKPDNILLTPDLTIKITDFGLATLKAGAATGGAESVMGSLNLHTQCGTPQYVAPEIIKVDPNGYSGAKVDTWACGVLLYVLVAGRHPFSLESNDELFKSIVRCDISYPSHFSESLKDLINNLLNTNPAERYSTAEVQQHPWFNGPTECTLEGFPEKIPTIPITIGVPLQRVPLEPSPIYPLPDENKQRRFREMQKAGTAASELLKNAPSKGSKDSLDFGTRVDSVGSDIALLALSNGVQRQLRAAQSSAGAVDPNLSTNGDIGRLDEIPSDSDERFVSKEGSVLNNSYQSISSEFGPDEGWVLTDTDRVVWCRLMKDFDMVPDILEFGMNSATLSEKWAKGLSKENLRKNSFAVGRFGMLPNARSRSPQYLSSSASAAACSPAKTGPDQTETHEAQENTTHFVDQPGCAAGSAVTGGEITTSQVRQNGEAVGELNPQRVTGGVSVMSQQVNGTGENQVQDEDFDVPHRGDIPSPSISGTCEEEVTTEQPPSSAVELRNVYPEKIGGGQDLLEDSNAGLDTVGTAGPVAENSQHLDLAVPNDLEPRLFGNVVGHPRSHGTAVTSPLPAVVPDSRRTRSPVVGQEKETAILSPFAIDVPGPRRPLPVTKTLLGSIVSSTVSPRRLLRRNATPLDIKSYTQFHSLLEPSSCFDVIQSVLRSYGCSITKTSSTRSRQKFRIRCELKKDDASVNARVNIYKVDDVLCTVHFKRLAHTEIKHFTRFYSDISRLYSEYLKQRGLSAEESTKRQSRSREVTRARFENQNSGDTVDVANV